MQSFDEEGMTEQLSFGGGRRDSSRGRPEVERANAPEGGAAIGTRPVEQLRVSIGSETMKVLAVSGWTAGRPKKSVQESGVGHAAHVASPNRSCRERKYDAALS